MLEDLGDLGADLVPPPPRGTRHVESLDELWHNRNQSSRGLRIVGNRDEDAARLELRSGVRDVIQALAKAPNELRAGVSQDQSLEVLRFDKLEQATESVEAGLLIALVCCLDELVERPELDDFRPRRGTRARVAPQVVRALAPDKVVLNRRGALVSIVARTAN